MKKITNNDFLTLTRQHETSLTPFNLEHELCTVEVWDTGVIYFAPKNIHNKNKDTQNNDTSGRNKAIVLSSAIHGNETAPIEICNDIITNLLNNEITLVHPTLFIFGNPPAINIGERFVEENLNRLFSGMNVNREDDANNDQNQERMRAKKLEQYVTDFYAKYAYFERIHYDLHTAIRDSAHEKFAVYPFIHGKPWKKEQFETLRKMGVTTFLLMQKPATTFSYYTSNVHQADTFTVELGKVKPFGQNDQSKFAAAYKTLTNLITGHEVDVSLFDNKHYQFMSVHKEVIKHNDSFQLSFNDDVANFTAFNKGDVFATEDDDSVTADVTGEAIVFPNAHVAHGQRALLTVIPVNIDDNLI